jgi:hypothetical protein
VLIVPVKFVHVKSFMTTVELFDLPTTAPFSRCVWEDPWLEYVCVTNIGKETL